MASRPLPPGRRGRGVCSTPARQNLPQPTLLSIDTAAPTTAASRWANTARSPMTDPAVAPKIEGPPRAAAITPAPVVEKKRATSSVFQSARAVFEAKQAATAEQPPPPPIRRRFTSPNRPAVVAVVKEQPIVPDFSSSTCSTVDSEGDREPKDIVDVPVEQHEAKLTSWKRPMVSEKREERTAVSAAPAHVVAKMPYSAPRPAQPVPLNPPVVTYPISPAMPTPVAAAAERVEGNQPDGGEIHPFRLLLPVDAIPTLPDEIVCVYDAVAVEMQKNVMKVVRKLLKKDKLRLNEFKVNARLFGNDFMDAHEYLDTLVKDFGGIRTLQLVPCLLSIQPDMMKRNALLLVAKNYTLQNEKLLERQCQALRSTSETKTSTKAEIIGSSVGSTPQVKSLTRVETPPPLKVDAKATLASVVATIPATPSKVPGLAPLIVETTANLVQAATSDPISITEPIEPASTMVFEPVAEPFASVPEVAKTSSVTVETAPTQNQPSTSELTQNQSTSTGGDAMAAKAAAANEVVVSKTVDASSEPPKPEPSVLVSAKATPHIAISTTNESSLAMVAAPPVKVSTAVPVGKEHPPSSTPSDSEEDGFQAENLFGEPIKPAPQLQTQAELGTHATTSSTSPSQSFDDAVNLFGERVAVASGPVKSAGKRVTWGEPQSVEAPTPSKSVRKSSPAPMIFGFATAGAYADDSDSNDSDFSD
ncbi:hypothetical protein BBJ28_00004237 [Nothophytophthora sp. Chile5]|nr:hypothetical protein BBJ28_00004237 [Nothophytophthora sp. Chile5]